MTTRTEIRVSPALDKWRRGFARVAEDAADVAFGKLQVATDLYFDATQRAVHVITGNLKASGDSYVDNVGSDSVEGVIVYDVEYARYERDRGGEHDFMAIGWETAAAVYERAMREVWAETVAGWRH